MRDDANASESMLCLDISSMPTAPAQSYAHNMAPCQKIDVTVGVLTGLARVVFIFRIQIDFGRSFGSQPEIETSLLSMPIIMTS